MIDEFDDESPCPGCGKHWIFMFIRTLDGYCTDCEMKGLSTVVIEGSETPDDVDPITEYEFACYRDETAHTLEDLQGQLVMQDKTIAALQDLVGDLREQLNDLQDKVHEHSKWLP